MVARIHKTRIKFAALGGSNNVGRHSLRFQFGDTHILFDPGMLSNGRDIKVNPNKLKGLNHIFITHAHRDHFGSLLEAMKVSPNAHIYCTPATKELIKCYFRRIKSANIQLLSKIKTIGHHKEIELGSGIYATFIPAGHILGAASVVIYSPEGNFLFTGDYSTSRRGLLTPFSFPKDTELRAMVSEGSLVGMSIPETGNDKEAFMDRVKADIEASKKIAVVADPMSVFLEYALMLSMQQVAKESDPFQIFINGWLKESFEIYLRFCRSMNLPQKPGLSLAHLDPYYDLPGAYCFFAGPGNLNGGFPRNFVAQILRDQGTVIVDDRYQPERVLGKLELAATPDVSPNQILSVFTTNHLTEQDMLSLVEERRPDKTVLLHGDADSLTSFANEHGMKVARPGRTMKL